jgi:cytidine deaminase
MTDVNALITAAKAVSARAYAPYSGFGVGAAVLLADGRVITGCNFENASYGMTLCAETVALAAVNSAGGFDQVRAIAITGGVIKDGTITGQDRVHPCGRCRQIIHEAAQASDHDILVYCSAAEGEDVGTYPISTLLPHAFGPKDVLG